MIDLEQRRSFDVRQQIKVLRAEFQTWRNESNPRTELEKHNTQLRRITAQLDEFLTELESDNGQQRTNEDLLRGLLFLNRIWAYFRDMFAMRAVSMLKDPLKCSDEFAWECYRPLWEQARAAGKVDVGRLKEPPLVFFTSSASPFIQRRDTPFEAEGVTAADLSRFNAALSFLPIPVIGVPWFQLNHLPSAVVIAHEVGHAVEQDFAVAAALDRVLADLPAEMGRRRSAWAAWRRELFADTFGILCMGPAHLFALSSFLVAPHAQVVQESVDWSDLNKVPYPTRLLRIAFNVEVLRQLGLNDEGVAAAWAQAYPRSDLAEYKEFLRDIPTVAPLFLQTPVPELGSAPVADFIKIQPAEWEAIKAKAQNLTAITRDEVNRFRRTIAASAWAYYLDPDAYLANAKYAGLSKKLADTILSGVRGPGAAADDSLRAAQAGRDKGLAGELFDFIMT